jgi:hydrogenase-1 operon protein HyaE
MNSTPGAVHPLIAALVDRHGFVALDAATFHAFAAEPGTALVLLLEDPARYRETLDLAVIAPELAGAFPGAFRCAVATTPTSQDIAARFGVRRWPALLLLRAGGYVGAIEGLRDWDDYLASIGALLEAPVTRPPGIGVVVRGGAPACGA